MGIVAAVQGFAREHLKPGDVILEIDERYYRPSEVETLLGDPTKAKINLGWQPEISFDILIDEMIETDLRSAQADKLLINANR